MNFGLSSQRNGSSAPDFWRRLLVSIFLLNLVWCGSSAQASCLPAPSGLVGFWPGDGNAKDIVATNNGTLTGGASASAAGVVGSGFSFNGTSSYVQIPDAPVLNPTNLTIETWVQLDAFASTLNSIGEQYLIFKKNTRGSYFEAFALTEVTNNTGQHVFHFVVIGTAGIPAKIDSTSLVSTGAWYHVAAVRGSNFLQLYVNGALEAQTSVAFPQDYGNTPLLFGTTGQAYDGKFKGRLDEVSLYNRALGSNEIAAIYLAGAAGKCKAPEITTPPQGQTIAPGNSASFSVTATGLNPLKYQWRSNGVPIAGAITNFYVTPVLPPASSGAGYSVVITNTAGSVTSAVATVTVCVPGLPDNFVCRQPLVGTSLAFVASNFGATYESGELPHFFTTGSNSIWYTWTAPFSGGLVFETSFAGFLKPIVAVYSGTSLTNLVKLVANSTVGNNSGGAPVARAVLTVVGGQNYQIVVDSLVPEYMTNTLTLSSAPANDLFVNATTINGIFFQAAGSFVGADREPSEPTHGDATLGQTLWWKWTAPGGGPNPISVRLMTDAVSFPPAVGVYTGNVVSALSPVTLIRATNGMTSDVVFSATPGTTYQIAVAGRQSESNTVSPLIGSFRLRLNTRVLALSITNLITSTNGSEVTFQANARIQNLGTNKSAPLRLSLSVISGQSTVQPLSTLPESISTNLSIINVTNSLGPNQSLLIPISGTAPAPTFEEFNAPVAYGVYADLQEQPVTNKWFTVDQTLVTYDKWPGIGEIFGPGGGVIRFDPGYTVAPFSPIIAMQILGATTLPEGRSTNYTGKVTFADATILNVTNTAWSASQFAIATNGMFTAGSVTSNTIVSLTLPYYFSGITFITSTNVIVLNLPAPTITNLALLGTAGFVFTLNGVPGRGNVIEVATNLASPTFWLPLATNAPASGVFTFTNFSRTNIPIRFFRAREQ